MKEQKLMNTLLIGGIIAAILVFGSIYTTIRTNSSSSDVFDEAPIIEQYDTKLSFDSL